MKFNITPIKASKIPFVQTLKEELLFKLRGETIDNLSLSKDNYKQPFVVDLKIEQTYSVELRIKWKVDIQPYTSNITGDEIQNSVKELICPHGELYTDRWKCNDGTYNSSELVCDGNPTCPDGSDEAKEICMGKETIEMKIAKYLIASKYFLGYFLFFLALVPCLKRGKRKNLFGETEPENGPTAKIKILKES